MNWLGDYKAGGTLHFAFTTHDANGAAVAPSTAFEAADLIVYKDGSATQRTSTSGVTMTSPFDSITGLHQVTIDLSDNTDAGFWAAGHNYMVVLSPDTETVASQTVVRVVASFSIENRCVNWAQVGSPTTTVGLSGTTIGTAATATNVTTVNGLAAGVITAAAIAADAITAAKIADGAIDAATFAAGAITAAAIAADAIDADALAADAVAEIQSGLSTLTAAGVRSAVGLATANLDTQLYGTNPVRTGTAQSGSTSSIILDAGASSVNDFYTGCLIRLTGGTGAGQVRLVADYLAAGKQVAVDRDFVTAPDGTTTFAILPALAPFMDSALRVTAAYVAGDVNGTVTPADGSITDAKFTVPAAAAGRPTGMLSMFRRVFEWRANKRTRDRSTGNKVLYDTDGTTALETQVQSTTSTVDQETQGA